MKTKSLENRMVKQMSARIVTWIILMKACEDDTDG